VLATTRKIREDADGEVAACWVDVMCGALRYEVSVAPVMVYNCHCTNCQKIGGGAFSTPVTIVEAAFAFTQGKPAQIDWTSDAGTRRWGLVLRRLRQPDRAWRQTPSNRRTEPARRQRWMIRAGLQPVGDIYTA
jgi:hypothetical protein